MQIKQNDLERIQDQLQQGLITADQANVEKVRCQRVFCVRSRIPADVRRALNNAVAQGVLCRIPKKGRMPEVYYHPTFDYLAKSERKQCELETLKALAAVCC